MSFRQVDMRARAMWVWVCRFFNWVAKHCPILDPSTVLQMQRYSPQRFFSPQRVSPYQPKTSFAMMLKQICACNVYISEGSSRRVISAVREATLAAVSGHGAVIAMMLVEQLRGVARNVCL